MITRREFLHLSASLGMLTAVGKLDLAQAGPVQDYKALVCLFMFGGNDGHNVVVPLESAQYAAYQSARGVLALPTSRLLPINDPTLGFFGLHNALPELQALFQQEKLAILANVGPLVEPTTYRDLADRTVPVPVNLRSHSRQIQAMQSGYPLGGGSTGWGGRALDQLLAYNGNTEFPVAIAMDHPALYCAGAVTRDICLQPGHGLEQNALQISPMAAAQARLTAQEQIIAAESGNAIANAANRVMIGVQEVVDVTNRVNQVLGSGAAAAFPKPFPPGPLGSQLKGIASIISLNAEYSVGRQVFFCSLGGFDTHSGQVNDQSLLLQQVSKGLDAFYAALSFMGLDHQVTAFTLSDFGRTLQPSGTGSDHGWGNHHVVLGGAVKGGRIYGRFPLMTNYGTFNNSADDFADGRGGLLPNVSLGQYGGTLARWFGATPEQLDSIFPELTNFDTRDIGFLA
jgi:uncharacterized protein (DUF1501 family)